MIRVEKIGQYWDVHMRLEEPKKEFGLVCAAYLKIFKAEELKKIIDGAISVCEEIYDMGSKQTKLFFLRFTHLMELEGTNLETLITELKLTKSDVLDIKNGVIPSTQALAKIAKRFGVSQEYLFGTDETDQRTN